MKCSDRKKYPYVFGWWVQESNGHRLLEHGGAWQGFTADISRYVDNRLTVVVLTNLDASHSDPRRIAHGVAMLYLPDLTKNETDSRYRAGGGGGCVAAHCARRIGCREGES